MCDVDRDVEAFMRAQLAEKFPDHAIVGEEVTAEIDGDARFTWVLDPLDGTSNFLDGVPLYASSVGVLSGSQPVVGAIWCASTHALRPGVYHARAGGTLHFNGVEHRPRRKGKWRGLASEPGMAPSYGELCDTRVLACAALECAFVAAGLLQLAYLRDPAIWDVCGGIALAQAAGREVQVRDEGRWRAFDGFDLDGARARRDWRRACLIGDPQVMTRVSATRHS